MKTKIAIILLSYNAERFLEKALFSFLAQFSPQLWQKLPEVEWRQKIKMPQWPLKHEVTLVVIDNASQDGSVLVAQRAQKLAEVIKGANIHLIRNAANLGFAAGNNVGINWALRQGFEYIGLLNNDVLVGNRFWEPLVQFLAKHRRAGVATTKIFFAPGYEYQQKYRSAEKGRVVWAVGGKIDWANVVGTNRGVDEVDKGQYERPAEVDVASGCLLLAKREVWKKVGLLDNRYFMYYEDADWSQRVKRQGWQVWYVPGGVIWHFNAGSSQVGGSLQDYFITRNRLLFGMRWAPWRAKLALLRESVRLLFSGREWQRRGIRDFYLRRFGRGSWR